MFSYVYKGFCIQQTEKGWIILCAPSFGNKGPIPPPPYETQWICENIINNYIY